MALAFDQLCTLVGNRPGVSDSACPLCSSRVSARGRVRRVMRVWREHDNFASFHCARCGEKGWARGQVVGSSTSDRVVGILRDAQAQVAERAESIRKARWLWSTSIPVTPETPVFTYLRDGVPMNADEPRSRLYVRDRATASPSSFISVSLFISVALTMAAGATRGDRGTARCRRKDECTPRRLSLHEVAESQRRTSSAGMLESLAAG